MVGRGYPRIGPQFKVNLPEEWIRAAERLAEERTTPAKRITRSDVIREWIAAGIKATQD